MCCFGVAEALGEVSSLHGTHVSILTRSRRPARYFYIQGVPKTIQRTRSEPKTKLVWVLKNSYHFLKGVGIFDLIFLSHFITEKCSRGVFGTPCTQAINSTVPKMFWYFQILLKHFYCDTVPPTFAMEQRVPWATYASAHDFKTGPAGTPASEQDHNLILFIQVYAPWWI